MEKPTRKPEYKNLELREIVKEGNNKALEIASVEPLRLGDLVYHASDDCVYKLRSIVGNSATVYLPAGTKIKGVVINEEIVRGFPYDELVDPKVLYEQAVKAKIENSIPTLGDPKKIN